MVHLGRELLSEARYFHSVSMLDDPFRIRDCAEKNGLKLSGLSCHCPLAKPEISVEYLKQAARFARECGAPVLNTDEGPKPDWTTKEEDFVLIRYTIMEAAKVASRRGIKIGLEQHQQYSLKPDMFDEPGGLLEIFDADLRLRERTMAGKSRKFQAVLFRAGDSTDPGRGGVHKHGERPGWL